MKISRRSYFFLTLTLMLVLQFSCKSPDPVSSFIIKPRIVNVGDTVHFINQSRNYSQVYWDFGDGHSSHRINDHHIYTKPGDFKVVLTVVENDKSSSNSLKVSVYRPDFSVITKSLDNDTIKYSYQTGQNKKFNWIINQKKISDSSTIKIFIDSTKDMHIILQLPENNFPLWDTTFLAEKTPEEKEEPAGTIAQIDKEMMEDEVEDEDEVVVPPGENDEGITVINEEKITVENDNSNVETTIFRKADVNPAVIREGEKITFDVETNLDVTWDFNREDSSPQKSGEYYFKSPGKKTVIVKDRSSGQQYEAFEVIVKPRVVASITPVSAMTGSLINYSCTGLTDARWDFNGEEVSRDMQGKIKFDSPGTKTISLYDGESNQLIESFKVKIIQPLSNSEFSKKLMDIGNEGLSRSSKRNIMKKIIQECAAKENTQVIGKENLSLENFLTKLMIESSGFVDVRIEANLEFNDNGLIQKVDLIRYDKLEKE